MAATNALDLARGQGRLRIRKGHLLRMPLFGGLSRYLSMLLPGFGYASQGEFNATFKVADGRIESDDMHLLGQLISLSGKGSVGFDGSLDVTVQVRFLKEGLTADVVRFLTSPLTTALEFQLSGTVQDPKWRPFNAPVRLLDFFNRQLSRPFGGGKKE